jgi:signal peptidase II
VRLGKLSWLSVLAAGLVLGGALGNLVDRVRLGYVVDFIEVYRPQITINNTVYIFPVFNVADSAITVGVILILIGLLFGKSNETAPAKVDATIPSANPETTSPQEPDADSDSAALREF